MSQIAGRIADGLSQLKQNPDLNTYGVNGDETILLRVRNQKLQAKMVSTASLKRNPSDTEIDPALIHRHKDYVNVGVWDKATVWNAESVLTALGAQAA